jgi:hypothetical protein
MLAGKLSIPNGCVSGQLLIYQTFSLSTAIAQFSAQKLTSTKIKIALSLKVAET